MKIVTWGAALLSASVLVLPGVVHAVPTPTNPVPVLAAGLNSHWVAAREDGTADSPHNITDALNALAGNGYTIQHTTDQLLDFIDIGDGSADSPAMLDPLSALGYDSFAVRYSGYLHIAVAGDYTFVMHHDDGIRVTLGGEDIIVFDGDTGPTDSPSGTYALDAGYYAFEAIGWEQGGQFINQFQRAIVGAAPVTVRDFWHEDAGNVPEPGMLALTGLGLLSLAGLRRRRRG